MITPPQLTVYLESVGLLGPGLAGWTNAAPVLADPATFIAVPPTIPAPDCLPAAERRRVGTLVKIALAAGREAVAHSGQDASALANVFSSSAGDGDNCHAICEALASSDRLISPTRFHNSVHNAAAGYWGIAMKCMAPSTSLCAFDGSFAAGLLEAAAQSVTSQAAALLVASDAPYPEPLHSVRPLDAAFAVGLVVNAHQSTKSMARLSLSLSQQAPSTLQHAALECIRLGSPAARALPLLLHLANRTSAACVVHLDYLAGCSVTLQLENI
jgi:hypothetical protein